MVTTGLTNLTYLLEWMYDYGIIVFFLIFTIVFAILQKTNILGSGKKNFNVIVALVMGLLVVVPHITNDYPPDYDVVNIINNAIPDVALLAIAGMMLLMLIGLFGGESRWMGASLSGWIAILAFIFIAVIFGSAAGWWGEFYITDYISDENIALVVIILVFAIIVSYITKDETKSEGAARFGKTLEDIGNFFGGKK